ncbi:alpha/beta hydrolase [uncultured Propionibacterium sp.]|uniref:alpha/beta hydrolase n=1 Tax=uncultured Propionibacterium sp. TaxID=218066 RepID=UPI00292DDD3A|nr:alpha/beta hydrolase [uncultured Propionibacterium sp.]
MLYLHGWNDYFFQMHLADWFDAQGFDFYAVELRRYGRNLVPGLYAGFVTSLRHYESELDRAVAYIREDHADVPITFIGHSTGGLTGALWASQRPGLLSGLILNSPWLDMQGSPALWRMLSPVAAAISAVSPLAELGAVVDTGFYRRCLRADEDGEWDWDLDLKSNPAFVHRWGWGRAVLAGQARVEAGLRIDTPVLVMTSARSDFSRTWDERMHGEDLVLDVERICSAAVHLGPMVTIRRFAGGVHDLVLSREPVRRQIFDEMARWIDAYVRPDGLIGQYRGFLGPDGAGAAAAGDESGEGVGDSDSRRRQRGLPWRRRLPAEPDTGR